jgi:hypothetical protein
MTQPVQEKRLVTHIRPANAADPVCYAWQVCASSDDGALPVYHLESKTFATASIPAPSSRVEALDTWNVARHMKDFGAFVSEVAPKLHWKIYQDLGSDMSRYSGYYDGWQCGFGEKVFDPHPLPDLIEEMKAAVSAALTSEADHG